MKLDAKEPSSDFNLPTSDSQDEVPDLTKPPIFSSWKGMYIFVLSNLAFMIILLYIFTISFK